MAQFPRTAAFRLDGPFLFKRTGNVGDLAVTEGAVHSSAQLRDAGVSDRLINQLYNGYWMDMAEPDAALSPVAVVELAMEPAAPEPAAPEPAAEGADEADGSDAPPIEAEHGDLVAYRSVGFGKYLAEDANGVNWGSRVGKVEAEQSTLPLLPLIPKGS